MIQFVHESICGEGNTDDIFMLCFIFEQSEQTEKSLTVMIVCINCSGEAR